MAKRRTSGIQRRERASADALNRRLDAGGGSALPDWRLLALGGLLLVGVLAVILVLAMGSTPSANAGTVVPDDGTTHVSVDASCRELPSSCRLTENPYSSLPATSGPHWDPSGIAQWGVYAAPQEESQLVHNLEHGGVVIWYDPERLDAESIRALTDYVNAQTASGVSGRYKFILTPWGGSDPLPSPVVATAWRYLLKLDSADTDAISEFARQRYGRSPEPNGGPPPPSQ